jgi:Zn-dependent protease with chaperone function
MMLGFAVRGLVQVLAAYFLASTVLSLAVVMGWRSVATAPATASLAAHRLFALRLLPSVGGLVTALLVALGYGLWEPRTELEPAGWVALAAAAGGAGLVLVAAGGLVAALLSTRRIRRALAAATRGTLPAAPLPASIIDTPFPIVAIVGLVLPRLFVARSVLEACSPEELDAVLAHEQAHARQHDNLRRLALAAAPDVLGLCAGGSRLDAAWKQAAEFAADEAAARGGNCGVHLASALLKVARLATGRSEPVPASALYQGEPIADRVRRLVDPPVSTEPRRWPVWTRAAVSAALLGVAWLSLPWLHHAAERLLKIAQ